MLGDLCVELSAHVETVAPVIRRLQHTVVVQVSQRSIVLDAPVATAHAQVVLLGHHPALVELVVPVRVGVCGRIRCRPLLAVRGLVQTAGIGPAGRLEVQDRLERGVREVHGLAAVQLGGIEIQGKGVGVHRLRHIQRAGETETVVVVDAHPVVVALLGRDQDHAEGGAGTVDGSRGCILQHRDVVDVLRIDRVDVTLHSVDQDQRRVRRTRTNRTGTTDTDGHGALIVQGPGVVCQLKTRQQALQRIGSVADRTRLDVFGSGDRYGTRQVHLLLGAEADHHHIFEHRRVLHEDDIVDCP